MSDTTAISSRYEFNTEDTLLNRSPIPSVNSDFVEKPVADSLLAPLVCSVEARVNGSEEKGSAGNIEEYYP